jgi:hypothetical protein
MIMASLFQAWGMRAIVPLGLEDLDSETWGLGLEIRRALPGNAPDRYNKKKAS